jgi:cell wall-associated NlpC family hydrolase
MMWAVSFVGIPYADLGRSRAGADCWGLARLVYREVLGLELPDYAGDYVSSAEANEVDALIRGADKSVWTQVREPQPFDLLLFRRGMLASHIGITVTSRMMLHMASGDHAKIECPTSPRWAGRFVSAWRHVDTPVKGAS